jgi:hypothetical protein
VYTVQTAPRPAAKAERELPKRLVYGAALSLLGFSAFKAVALAANFHSSDDPWSWRTMLALLCAALGLTTAALVWRAPSKAHLTAGLGVMGASLLGVGLPGDWGLKTFLLVLPTALFLIPLVRAAMAMWKE